MRSVIGLTREHNTVFHEFNLICHFIAIEDKSSFQFRLEIQVSAADRFKCRGIGGECTNGPTIFSINFVC